MPENRDGLKVAIAWDDATAITKWERSMNEREASAFNKGAAARRRGKSESDNPYHHATSIQSANFWAWKAGWKEQDSSTAPVKV